MSAYLLVFIFPVFAWLILISSIRSSRAFRWLTFTFYSFYLLLIFVIFWLESSGIPRFAFFNFERNFFGFVLEFSINDLVILASIGIVHLVYLGISEKEQTFTVISTHGILILGFTSLMIGLADRRLSGSQFILIILLLSEILYRMDFSKIERTRFSLTYLLGGMLVLVFLYLASSDGFRSIQNNHWMEFLLGIVIIALFSLFPFHFWIYSLWEKPFIFGYAFLVITTLGVFWLSEITGMLSPDLFLPDSISVFHILIAVNLVYAGFLGVFNSGWNQLIFGIVVFDLVRVIILAVDLSAGWQYAGHFLYRIIFFVLLMWLYRKYMDSFNGIEDEGGVKIPEVNPMWKYLVGFTLIGVPLTPGFGSYANLLRAVSGSSFMMIAVIMSFLALSIGLIRLMYSEILVYDKIDLRGLFLDSKHKLYLTVFFIWGLYDIIRVITISGIFQ